MALNFSHRPIFLNGDSECHGNGFCNLLRSEGDVKDCFDYGRDRSTSGGCSQESISNDILDLLPSDPFEMEISTTFTAITGWLEDLEMDYGGYASEVVANNAEDYRLFAGLNILWNNAMVFQAFPGSYGFDCNTHMPSESCEFYGTKGAPVGGSTCSGFRLERGTYGCLDSNRKGSTLAHLGFGPPSRLGEFSEMKSTGDFSCHDTYGSANSYVASPVEREISLMFDSSSDCGQHSPVQETGSAASFDGFMSVEGFDGCIKKIEDECLSTGDSFETVCKINDSWTSSGRSTGNSRSEIVISGRSCDGNGLPHMALTFVLSYLAIQDLLSVERVCKFLRSTVQTDPLLWRSIQIGQPLNEKITDDVLLQLSARAQGNLKCLSVVECPRITDEGLKLVVQSNPRITKLSVPGCTRVSINGILDILKTLKSTGSMRVKHLRVGGLYGVNMEQFEELKTLLGLDNIALRQNTYMPHFFQREKYLSFEDDDRNIDIEVCPRCVNLRLVYDCPTDACRGKIGDGVQSCRACTICIPRCYQCGRCINDGEYEENFCLELLCLDCSLQHNVKCEQMLDDDVSSNPRIIVESSG